MPPQTTERAAKWIRVSSGGQDEENQVPAVSGYIRSRGYALARTAGERGTYQVHGKSAYHGEHQGDLDRALADARAGKYDVLVIWHSDRLERRKAKGKTLLDTLAEFTEAG